MNFSVGVDEYSDSEAIMPTAEIIHFSERKWMTLFISCARLTKGMWKTVSEEIFTGGRTT